MFLTAVSFSLLHDLVERHLIIPFSTARSGLSMLKIPFCYSSYPYTHIPDFEFRLFSLRRTPLSGTTLTFSVTSQSPVWCDAARRLMAPTVHPVECQRELSVITLGRNMIKVGAEG